MNKRPERAKNLDALRHSFGTSTVSPDQRRTAVTALFDRVAPRYDLMNDLMSFGLHRLWKRHMVRLVLQRLAGRGGPLVDLAGGTGDIALAVKSADPDRQVIVADASAGMLEVAKARAGDRLQYLHAQAEALPLADDLAAGVTLAFGLRNMTDPNRALAEVRRVLAPGASLFLLEFSRPAPWFAPFYALHSRLVIPVLGALVARDRGAYTYLVESIRLFPAAGDITLALETAGLCVTDTRPFMFGVAMLHVAKMR